jgi:membrane protease YdiL (CAAX protease family)
VDLVVVASITVLWPVWENVIAWPRFVRDVSGGAAGVRAAGYRHGIVTQWAISLFALAAWIWRDHPWGALPLWPAHPLRPVLGAAIALGAIVLMALQLASVRKSPAARAAVRRQIGDLDPLLPRRPAELPWFLALSVTAGICEEWLFRGVLTTLVAGWLGLPLAVAASCLAFGFAHAYQGRAGIAKTALVGLAFSLIVLASGSLLPAMIVHAAIDVGSGLATYVVLSEGPARGEAAGGDAG